MKVEVTKTSGFGPNTVRMTGRIQSSEGPRDVWFEVPGDLESSLSVSGAPWLMAMLPLAVKTGESIELSLPIDPLLLENVRGLVSVWKHWYPDLRHVEILAPTGRAAAGSGLVAQFFSGGVDSWFTLLRHTESTPRFPQVGAVDELITIWGFDIAIDRPDEFRQLSENVSELAQKYGKRHVVVATNLREDMKGSWKAAWGPGWGALSHGAGLAAAGLILEGRYSQLKIASTSRFCEPYPWGTHPLTDSLFSTSRTAFLHDHSLYRRTDKIERIAESDYALSRLKVCANGTFANCSRCVKCHRMLLCFDILGILEKATSFDLNIYQENRNRPILIWSENDYSRVLEVRDLAIAHGRLDIASLMDQSIKKSKRVKSITEKLKKVSWRVWNAGYRRLAGGMIGA